MAEVLLFHHAQGLTPGMHEFAATLRDNGHTVHLPDLFDGRTFDTVDDGVNHARSIGFGTLVERGRAVANELPTNLVYAGFSMGVMPAQSLAQTRAGARGALFFSACLPVSEFSDSWPVGVPVQIHSTEADPEFVDTGDIEAARALVEEADDAELFLYPGDSHLFVDSSLPSFQSDSAAVLTEYVLRFLDRLR
jgi:dienelactone hydrolase